MKRLLHLLVDRIIRSGSLIAEFADGTQEHFGDGTGAPVHIRFASTKAVRGTALNPKLKLGEGYMNGEITFPGNDVYDFLDLVFRNMRERRAPQSFIERGVLNTIRGASVALDRINTLHRSRHNVRQHYDLSGELYDLFLDTDRQYSCAYFEKPGDDLETAQLAKKQLIASKLVMDRENLRVLDIGSGWGGLGLHLARQFNAAVTGVTLSEEQLSVSSARAREDGFGDQVDFRLEDYRHVDQHFDRIVSVGMFEHVGRKHYQTYFDKCATLLERDGVMLLHTIGQSDPPSPTNSFIKKYIFPGGYIPALSDVIAPIERSGLVITDIEILRMHYADTLKAWRNRFHTRWEDAARLYDERFCRMWDFYLASSEVAFRWQDLVVFQIQLSHNPRSVPLTRDYIAKGMRSARRAAKSDTSTPKQRPARAGRSSRPAAQGGHDSRP